MRKGSERGQEVRAPPEQCLTPSRSVRSERAQVPVHIDKARATLPIEALAALREDEVLGAPVALSTGRRRREREDSLQDLTEVWHLVEVGSSPVELRV
jgi:hypothetical protein